MSFIGAAAIMGSSLISGLFSGGDEVQYNAPTYYNDPMVQQTQNALFPYATSMMTGQGLPSAYQDLIQPNSQSFQQMLSRITGNTLSGVQSNMAAQGISDSGIANSAAAQSIGDISSSLTYQDFLNSQSNQLSLMGMGTQTMGNLENNALTNQGQQNNFNLANAAAEAGVSYQNANLNNQASANWGNLIGSGLSAAANIYGMNTMSNSIKGLGSSNVANYSSILGSANPNVNNFTGDYLASNYGSLK